MSHVLSISPFFPPSPSSELESDFNGDSSNSEVGEGRPSLLEPPACPAPAALQESPKASKVADGEQRPELGWYSGLSRGWMEVRVGGGTFPSGGCYLRGGQVVPVVFRVFLRGRVAWSSCALLAGRGGMDGCLPVGKQTGCYLQLTQHLWCCPSEGDLGRH